MSTDAVVEVAGLSFGYASDQSTPPVLQDVDLVIEARDFLGIVGPNGGGKTTLLKIILGLLTPQSGSVTVFGLSPFQARRQVGYVPQHAQVDPSIPADVLDVVLTGRLSESMWGPRYARADVDIARESLRKTDTEDLARRPIGTLSGGQRQRVLIARALASDSKLLLLDEPTAGVDAHMERGLLDLLKQLNESIPIVMISHDISFVSAHLKRVACLNNTLTCHAADQISDDVVATMYHGHVQAVHHDEDCSHADGHKH